MVASVLRKRGRRREKRGKQDVSFDIGRRGDSDSVAVDLLEDTDNY
jgi:hypothetical protein